MTKLETSLAVSTLFRTFFILFHSAPPNPPNLVSRIEYFRSVRPDFAVLGSLTATFWELIRTPFQNPELIWGIVPLYFGWFVNELTSSKASFSTAVQTGFALLWAVAQWIWQAFREHPTRLVNASDALPAVNWAVNAVVLLFGAMALWAGLRHRYPKGGKFLGHTRFAGYFMIAIFPIQAGTLHWNWDRLGAVAAFALPVWLVTHLLLVPLRK